MSEVDSDRPSCLELHGRELLEDLVPDGAHHVSLLPGVDIRRGLLEPVSQVLASLGMCVWNAQSGMKTRKEYSHVLDWRALLHQGVFEPPQGPVWGSWAGDESRPVLVDRGDQVVHLAELLRGPESLPPPLQGDPPSGPREGEQWGDKRDRATADVVFVCQASSSRVLLVDLTVCGEVRCTSLKRALQARLNLAIAMMYLSTALVSSGTRFSGGVPFVPGPTQFPGSEPPLCAVA